MKKIVLSLVAVIIIFVLVVLFFANRSGNIEDVFPIPTQFQTIRNEAEPGASLDDANTEENSMSFKVSELISKLPHKGSNFSLYFNVSENSFVLYINPGAKDAGNKEFDSYLSANGIPSREFLENIFVTYITPTPENQETSATPAP